MLRKLYIQYMHSTIMLEEICLPNFIALAAIVSEFPEVNKQF